ncbi:MAG: hypothetical protein AB7O38_04760 [Pirellulaceae bacterium]
MFPLSMGDATQGTPGDQNAAGMPGSDGRVERADGAAAPSDAR